MRSLLQRLPLLSGLILVWMLLWEDVSVANAVGGALAGGGVLLLSPAAGPQRFAPFRPLAALRFAGYFLYKLVEANLVVAWEVITPNNDSIRLGIVAVPMRTASDAVITVVANAITLTPGTLTLEVRRDPPTLYVHVLHLRSIEQARAEVRKLERLVIRAFGDEDALRRAEHQTPPSADTGGSPWRP